MSAPATSFTNNQSSTGSHVSNGSINIPYYESTNRGVVVWNQMKILIDNICSDTNKERLLAGQELLQMMQNYSDKDGIAHLLLSPTSLSYHQPDMNFRRHIAENPTVILTLSDMQQREATLTVPIYNDICNLSDTLFIPENDALSLYHYVESTTLSSDNNKRTGSSSDTPLSRARKFFFHERSLILNTVLVLLQTRQKSDDVAHATEILISNGLVNNLVRLVREYTALIDMLLDKIEQIKKADLTNLKGPDSENLQVHLEFCFRQRQLAVECLYFIAYDVQLTVEEMCVLLDLLKDLTNSSMTNKHGLRQLDPYMDVPDPYDYPHTSEQMMHPLSKQHWFQHRKDKDLLEWQRQLVESVHKTGYPQLLRCVGTLIVTCIAGFDTQNVLRDRFTHAPNSFGKGNAILPPNSVDFDQISPITERLCMEAAKSWNRPDVVGIVMAAYAVMLHSTTHLLTSPRSADSTGNFGELNARKVMRECLRAPAELKAFTFGRLCLIPSLQKPINIDVEIPVICDVADFLMTSLSEFLSTFLDLLSGYGDRPISRAKWTQDVEEAIRLQRSYEEQQKRFQGQFSVFPTDASTTANNSDDYDRPDCLDDVISFATAVCSCSPEYSIRFWSQLEYTQLINGQEEILTKLSPSLALKELQHQQTIDESLRPVFISFLAALAAARNDDGSLSGADTIHSMFSTVIADDGDGLQQSWITILETLRHYVRELNPKNNLSGSPPDSRTTANVASTAYYYLDDDVAGTSDEAFKDAKGSISHKELGDDNIAILSSHLTLISCVAENSPEGRCHILSCYLPIRSLDQRDVVGRDGSLGILWTLSIIPLPPGLRGMVFKTIACLLSLEGVTDSIEVSKVYESAYSGWEMLDAYQIVPIRMLDKYRIEKSYDEYIPSGLYFPMSSTSLVAEKSDKTWIPADVRYSILYEMEYIESSMGFYPSTEGFLSLLKNLFTVGGCCPLVGNQRRINTTPYIEYIVNLVIPRITGDFMKEGPLPFRSTHDLNRILSLALEVVERVLSMYSLSSHCLSGNRTLKDLTSSLKKDMHDTALHELGCASLAKGILVDPSEEDAQLFLGDFYVKSESKFSNSDSLILSRETQFSLASSLNGCKSPGFTILYNILNPYAGSLVKAVSSVLKRKQSVAELEADRFVLAFSLYGTKLPTIFAAKEGARNRNVSTVYSHLQKAPFLSTDFSLFVGARQCEERCTLVGLRLVCSAIAREVSWNNCVQSVLKPLIYVPSLNVQRETFPVPVTVQCAQLSKTLVSLDSESEVVSCFIECVQPDSSDDEFRLDIATAAVAIIFYFDQSLHHDQLVDLFYAHSANAKSVATAFFGQFKALVCAPFSTAKEELLQMLLEKLLSSLRSTGLSKITMTHTILGLPWPLPSGHLNTVARVSPSCFEAITTILNDQSLLVSPDLASPISSCYEILYHVTKAHEDQTHSRFAFYSITQLRREDFWNKQILNSILHDLDFINCADLMHTVSWMLKGASAELLSLAGIHQHAALLSPQPIQYNNLFSVVFFAGGILEKLICLLPINKLRVEPINITLQEELLCRSKRPILGAHEVVRGFELLDCQSIVIGMDIEGLKDDIDIIRSWANEWNAFVLHACALSHLSNSMAIVVGCGLDSWRYASVQWIADRWNGWRITIAAVNRLCPEDTSSRKNSVIDDNCSELATSNLAFVALLATHMQLSTQDNGDTGFNASTTCHRLAQAIINSGVSCDGSLANRRTSWLASSLFLILSDFQNGDMILDSPSIFMDAAFVLAKLACCRTVTLSRNMPESEPAIARKTLSVVFEYFCNSQSESSSSFMQNVLLRVTPSGSQVLELLISSLSHLDRDTPTLFAHIAALPSGTNLLLEFGLMSGLDMAASTYLREEAVNEGRLENVASVAGRCAPKFFLSHLRLMNAMMVSDCPLMLREKMRSGIVSILCRYDTVSEQLLSKFPLDFHTVRALVNCLALVNEIGSVTSLRGLSSSSYTQGPIRRKLHLTMIALKIASCPLPPELSVALRKATKNYALVSKFDSATVSTDSWWASVEVDREGGTDSARVLNGWDETLPFAVFALDLMLAGFTVVRDIHALSQIQTSSLCQALHGCVDALRLVDSYVSHIQHWPKVDFEIIREKILVIESKLAKAVVDLLCVLAYRFKNEATPREVTLVLEYNGLGRLGLDLQRSSTIDENTADFVCRLSSLLINRAS